MLKEARGWFDTKSLSSHTSISKRCEMHLSTNHVRGEQLDLSNNTGEQVHVCRTAAGGSHFASRTQTMLCYLLWWYPVCATLPLPPAAIKMEFIAAVNYFEELFDTSWLGARNPGLWEITAASFPWSPGILPDAEAEWSKLTHNYFMLGFTFWRWACRNKVCSREQLIFYSCSGCEKCLVEMVEL